METLQHPPHAEARDYDRQQREYDDATTWLAEVLEGQMRTSFEYSFDGYELYGRDGGALSPIFKTAIRDAELSAKRDPRLAFEVRRRWTEDGELDNMLSMARDELPNTMVVVSDSPPELEHFSQDIAGYNVRRKQTMLRVITKGIDGRITMRSQSLDRSDRQALEAIYRQLGFEPQPGELLGQRMHLELQPEDQEFLTEYLTGIYDRALANQHGGEWYAGRTPVEMLNTYDFVRSQADLVDEFVRQRVKNPEHAENLRYGLAAAMDRRFRSRSRPDIMYQDHQTAPFRPDALNEMWLAGQEAKSEGRTFSGCGLSLGSLGNDLSTVEQLGQLGYGDKLEKDKFGPLNFKCPKGHWNKRRPAKSPKDFLPHCKTCGTSLKC